MINKDDLNILKLQDHNTLIAWYLILNSWGWPEELPNKEYPIRIRGGFKNVRRRQIMDWIRNKVSHKAILRTHNKDMTDKEFDDFWKDNGEWVISSGKIGMCNWFNRLFKRIF